MRYLLAFLLSVSFYSTQAQKVKLGAEFRQADSITTNLNSLGYSMFKLDCISYLRAYDFYYAHDKDTCVVMLSYDTHEKVFYPILIKYKFNRVDTSRARVIPRNTYIPAYSNKPHKVAVFSDGMLILYNKQ